MAKKLASEKGKQLQPQPLSRQIKILTTAAILLGNVAFGCSMNSFAPALDNMRSKYATTIEDISVVFTVITIMYCCGATICGFISRYTNRQLVVICALAIMASSIYMAPYCPDKGTFFISGGILGFSTGLYDSSQMVWMIEIWQHKSAPFIQAQCLFYGIGSGIPTLLIAPFLINYDHANVNATDSSPTETSPIHIPFLIMGTLNSLALLFQLFLFTFYRYHTPPMYANENFELLDDAKNVPSAIEPEIRDKNVSMNEKGNAPSTGVSIRKIKLLAVTILFLGIYQAMEVSTMQFLPIFGQYSDLKMTESASAYVLTGLIGMACVGRLIGAIITSKVQLELIIAINFILVITGNVILLVWANNSLPMFWLGSAILGIGYSTIYPGFCAFMEKYLVFTTSVSSAVLVFGSSVSSVYPVIIGKFIERRAVVLVYTNMFSAAVGIVVMIWGYLITRKNVVRER